VQGGSQSYTRVLLSKLNRPVRLNAKVESVTRTDAHVTLSWNGNQEQFDHVVFACHSDQALKLLQNPTQAETEVLGALQYQSNDVLLHTDTRIMPKNKRAWAAWNAHLGDKDHERCTVTYWMNLLQSIQAPVDFLVSLNSSDRIDPKKVLRHMRYDHPIYTHQTVRAQRRREEINGLNRSYFCGAYWGFGFHEDGLRSGVDVAAMLGCAGLAHPSRAKAS
jgi:uncharacterized protein